MKNNQREGGVILVGDIIITIMEWIGTVSFAVSGALVAIRSTLDLFGVITVGCITAVGGGIIRDLLLGNTPPKVFFNPLIVLVACLTTLVVFIVAYIYRNVFEKIREKTELVNVFFDALGLAAFSITGVEIAHMADHDQSILLEITLGVLTGVGGGVLRDVLVNEKPYILTKHIYAVVSVAGCCLYYVVSIRFGYKVFATVAVLILTVLMRILAAKFRWKLPKVRISDINS